MFKVFTDLIQQFFDRSTAFIMVINMVVFAIMTFIALIAFSPYNYGMSHILFVGIRVAIMAQSGWL